MKLLLLCILLTLLSFKQSFCQPTFQNDTSFKPFWTDLLKMIDSSFHLVNSVEFELRFWTLVSKSMERRLFILSLKDNKWTARLFIRKVYLTNTLVEMPVSQTNLDELWNKLQKNNLLTIPNEVDLRDKNGEELNNPIHDGISYNFELITQNNKRSYWYHCPKINSQEYKYIKSFTDVVSIINLINKHCALINYICSLQKQEYMDFMHLGLNKQISPNYFNFINSKRINHNGL